MVQKGFVSHEFPVVRLVQRSLCASTSPVVEYRIFLNNLNELYNANCLRHAVGTGCCTLSSRDTRWFLVPGTFHFQQTPAATATSGLSSFASVVFSCFASRACGTADRAHMSTRALRK